MELFVKIVNGFQLLTIFAMTFLLKWRFSYVRTAAIAQIFAVYKLHSNWAASYKLLHYVLGMPNISEQ